MSAGQGISEEELATPLLEEEGEPLLLLAAGPLLELGVPELPPTEELAEDALLPLTEDVPEPPDAEALEPPPAVELPWAAAADDDDAFPSPVLQTPLVHVYPGAQSSGVEQG